MVGLSISQEANLVIQSQGRGPNEQRGRLKGGRLIYGRAFNHSRGKSSDPESKPKGRMNREAGCKAVGLSITQEGRTRDTFLHKKLKFH